ncbi:scavenger receptor cysteine-rich type 1 protein M130-like [Heterodontus francisci]|uniref:scavenger receptor cysteine-rich type 1 protein M130-like n=1 Tax=Heterodontus francisci TaxID=7792 RepID=UPI00355C940C
MDVGVLCSDHVQLRLSGGGSPCTGRVEIYYNRTWGSVCADSWDLADADVVCKQLGCGKALDMSLTASCGPDSGPVWLDELNCSGNESFLWECPSASWDNHDCSHEEDVRIMCSEHKELRLVNGKHRFSMFLFSTEAKVIKEQPHRSKDCIREHDCKRVLSPGANSSLLYQLCDWYSCLIPH